MVDFIMFENYRVRITYSKKNTLFPSGIIMGKKHNFCTIFSKIKLSK